MPLVCGSSVGCTAMNLRGLCCVTSILKYIVNCLAVMKSSNTRRTSGRLCDIIAGSCYSIFVCCSPSFVSFYWFLVFREGWQLRPWFQIRVLCRQQSQEINDLCLDGELVAVSLLHRPNHYMKTWLGAEGSRLLGTTVSPVIPYHLRYIPIHSLAQKLICPILTMNFAFAQSLRFSGWPALVLVGLSGHSLVFSLQKVVLVSSHLHLDGLIVQCIVFELLRDRSSGMTLNFIGYNHSREVDRSRCERSWYGFDFDSGSWVALKRVSSRVQTWKWWSVICRWWSSWSPPDFLQGRGSVCVKVWVTCALVPGHPVSSWSQRASDGV